MRKCYFVIFLLLNFSGVRAQITLGFSDYHRFDNRYYRGFVYNNFSGIEFSPAGPGQFWDYFFLEQDFADTLTIVKADLTPYFSAFPDADLAITTNNQSFFYESLNPGGVTIQGRAVYDPVFDNVLISPFEFDGFSFPYPLEYGDSYSFSYRYVSYYSSFLPGADSVRIHSNSNLNINLDASGLLTVPCGTFEVLRFRQNSTTLDSIFGFIPQQGWVFNNTYRDTTQTDLFYTNEVGASLLTISGKPDGQINSVSFLRGFVINSSQEANDRLLQIYPQPAQHQVQIVSTEVFRAMLMDVSGRVVADFTLNAGANTFDRNNLPDGLYFLHCINKSGERVMSRRLVFVQQ
jgi:hypothetical protein